MTRSRLKLALLALLFIAPLALASLAYVLGWFEGGQANYGTLVTPARPLPPLTLVGADGAAASTVFSGKWSLVQLGGDSCDEACGQRLILTRQVRLALAKKRQRVQRVYVAPDDARLAAARGQLADAHPDLVFVADRGAGGARLADVFAPPEPHAVQLVDPLGNWAMVYTGTIDPKGLHRDLRKLLHFSQAG